MNIILALVCFPLRLCASTIQPPGFRRTKAVATGLSPARSPDVLRQLGADIELLAELQELAESNAVPCEPHARTRERRLLRLPLVLARFSEIDARTSAREGWGARRSRERRGRHRLPRLRPPASAGRWLEP